MFVADELNAKQVQLTIYSPQWHTTCLTLKKWI